MSMLAERRRKSKYVLNPTKKPLWTTDSSGIKFGKELMEKMGWSAGKGLGANEQGMQEPLKVSYKNDSKGMGYKGNEENWIEYQDEFNCLLNQLAGNTQNNVIRTKEAEKSDVMSLEEKSKLSKARVHYQKFTRGKDISKYSEEDLSCILGTGKMKKANNETAAGKETPPENNVQETSFGVTTINSGSIKDYFKKKWTLNNLRSENSNIEQPQNVFDIEQQFNGETNSGSGKRSKKRQRESKEESLKDENVDEGNEILEKEIKKHKKKSLDFEGEILSKKERETNTEIDVEIQKNEKNQLEVDNSPEDIFTDCVKDVLKSRKKKKKKRECEELKELEHIDGEQKSQSEVSIVEIKNKKRKKPKESEVESVKKSTFEEEVNGNMEEEPQNETRKIDLMKKKKRKTEKKAEELLVSGNNCEIEVNGGAEAEELKNNTEVAAEEKTRKKKEKKKKDAEFQNQKIQLKDAIEEQSVKKKKKKKEERIENLQAEGVRNGDENEREKFQNEGVIKEEKKKKKKHLEPEKEEEEEQKNTEFLGMEVALTEKKKKIKNKENTETQSRPVEVTKKSKKIKKEKKEEESENKDYQLEVNGSESQEKVTKKKDKTKLKSCSETMNIRETENEMSSNKEKKENKNGEIGFIDEVGVTLVHTHKAALFRMKKPFVDDFKKCSTAKALNLICGADIEKFKGANLGNLLGYGYKKTIAKNVDR